MYPDLTGVGYLEINMNYHDDMKERDWEGKGGTVRFLVINMFVDGASSQQRW